MIAETPPAPTAPLEPLAITIPDDTPESDEDRADAVLSSLEAYDCDEEDECGASARPLEYPDVHDPEVERRWVTDEREYVRSLGVELRWDPGSERLALERGNTPTYGGDIRDDP